MEERDAVIKPRKTQTCKEIQGKMNMHKLREKSTSIQPHSSAGSVHGGYDYTARDKAAKMRPSNAESQQKLSSATIECCE